MLVTLNIYGLLSLLIDLKKHGFVILTQYLEADWVSVIKEHNSRNGLKL